MDVDTRTMEVLMGALERLARVEQQGIDHSRQLSELHDMVKEVRDGLSRRVPTGIATIISLMSMIIGIMGTLLASRL